MSLNFLARTVLGIGAAGLALAPAARGQDDPTATARRVAAAAAIAVDEYGLGVRDGHLIKQDEVTEARLFLGEAREEAGRLPESVRSAASEILARLLDRARALEPVDALRGDLARLRRTLAEGLGVALDPMPQVAPSLASGARIYRETCASCHGAAGAGNGPAGTGLQPPPADLTSRARLRGTSPLEFFRKISVGVAGTAMAGYEGRLSLGERWAVALYVSGLRFSDRERAAGKQWVALRCAGCDVVLSDFSGLADVSDDSLSVLLAEWSGAPPPDPALAYARTAGAAEVVGGDRALVARRVGRAVDSMIADVERLARGGRREQAAARALEAYLAFEGIERDVGARSAAAVHDVERTFADLRAVAAAGGDVTTAAVASRRALAAGVDVVTLAGSASVLFWQSLLIILREGLEAILIIGALVAFLSKAGARERGREIGVGAGLAIAASVATAAAFATVIRVSAAQQEAIEGLTMLLASVVLFWVASWLVSKIEAQKWRAFVQAKMRAALGSGRTFALGGVAFLAVYREGVETVLFYGALVGTAKGPAAHLAIGAGLALGSAGLAVIYLAIQRWGLRIPLKPFFAVTGMLLTVMAVSFAGQGVAELQAAGWVPATPLRLPSVPVLGVFPTWQTVLAQFCMAAAFFGALAWILWPGRRPSAMAQEGRRTAPPH